MRKTVVFIFGVLLLVFTGRAWAQTETGQISGTVADQQDNGVPKAKIVIRNLGTGALRETASDDHGFFVVTNLLPARYAVLVEAPGFTKLDQQVDLAPGGRVALDLKLQVGQITETIEVLRRRLRSTRNRRRLALILIRGALSHCLSSPGIPMT